MAQHMERRGQIMDGSNVEQHRSGGCCSGESIVQMVVVGRLVSGWRLVNRLVGG